MPVGLGGLKLESKHLKIRALFWLVMFATMRWQPVPLNALCSANFCREANSEVNFEFCCSAPARHEAFFWGVGDDANQEGILLIWIVKLQA